MTQNYTINCIQLRLQFVLAEPGYCPPWGRHTHMAVLAGAKALGLSAQCSSFLGESLLGLTVSHQVQEDGEDPGVPWG